MLLDMLRPLVIVLGILFILSVVLFFVPALFGASR